MLSQDWVTVTPVIKDKAMVAASNSKVLCAWAMDSEEREIGVWQRSERSAYGIATNQIEIKPF